MRQLTTEELGQVYGGGLVSGLVGRLVGCDNSKSKSKNGNSKSKSKNGNSKSKSKNGNSKSKC